MGKDGGVLWGLPQRRVFFGMSQEGFVRIQGWDFSGFFHPNILSIYN